MALVFGGNAPAVKVEIAFVANPYATSLTWTDVTQYVDQVDTNRGRNYELGKTEAGTVTLAMRNLDGRFDPMNTASPYYPYVLPYRPLRVTATWLGITYPLWSGYVERFPQKWSMGGSYGTVDVTAVDGFKTVLSKTFGLRYFEEVQQDKPTYLFRFSETPGSANYMDAQGTGWRMNVSTATPTATLSDSLVAGSPDFGRTAVAPYAVNNTNSPVGLEDSTGAVNNVSFAGDFTLEFLGKVSTVPTDGSSVDYLVSAAASSPATSRQGWISANFASGGAYYSCSLFLGAVTTAITLSTAVRPTAGRSDHFVITRSGSAISVVVNGTTLGTLTSSATMQLSGGAGFATYMGYVGTAPSGLQLTVDEAAFYPSSLSAARISRHYTAATVPQEFISQLSGAQASAVLDSVMWPASARSIEYGISNLQATGSLSGKTALTVLQEAADAELGNVFIDGQGRFVFHDRRHRAHDSSVATFGENNQPTTTRTNLCTNPSFETGTTGWGANGTPAPTLSTSTAQKFTGTQSMLITWATGASYFPDAGYQFTTVVGKVYTVSAYVYVPSGNPPVQPYVYANGFRAPTTVFDTWTRIFYTFTAGDVTATFGILPLNAPTAGQICYVDAVMIEQDTGAVGSYIDGSQPSCAWTGAANASTSTGPSDPETPYLGDITIEFDDTYIVNDVQITQANSTPVLMSESADSTSQSSYGLRVLQRTVALTSKSDVSNQAATLLSWYKDPRPRVPQLSLEGRSHPSNFGQMLGREIGDLVTVNRRPQGASAIGINCFIDGIKHSITSSGWTTTFMLTPQLPNATY